MENWIGEVIQEFNNRKIEAVYLLTSKEISQYPEEIEDKVVDFYYLEAPLFFPGYIHKETKFLTYNLPYNLVFSSVDELLLVECFVKKNIHSAA